MLHEAEAERKQERTKEVLIFGKGNEEEDGR
jgi:hypothetical protein